MVSRDRLYKCVCVPSVWLVVCRLSVREDGEEDVYSPVRCCIYMAVALHCYRHGWLASWLATIQTACVLLVSEIEQGRQYVIMTTICCSVV